MQTTHLALLCAACMSISAGLVYASTPSGGLDSRARPEAEPNEANEPARTKRSGPWAGAGAAAIATSTSEHVAEAPTAVPFDPPTTAPRPIVTSKATWRVKQGPPSFDVPKVTNGFATPPPQQQIARATAAPTVEPPSPMSTSLSFSSKK